jgi:hypothetical protein
LPEQTHCASFTSLIKKQASVLHWSVGCVTVIRMLLIARRLILCLLCCLLPVHSGLALAGAVSMISQHSHPLSQDSLQHSPHQAHQQTQHSSHHHAPSAADEVVAEPSASLSSTHTPAYCWNFAKCCLAGAVAPPPSVMETPVVFPVTRIVGFSALRLVDHVPEAPERPPRSQRLFT